MKYLFNILLAILIGASAMAQDNETTERYSKAYQVSDFDYLEVSNKYGDIEVRSWDKDSVTIEVEKTIISERYEWREKMKDQVQVEFERATGFVLAQTTWSADVGISKKSTFDVVRKLGSKNRIEVNYVIHVPKGMDLEISNRFGNVYMGSHQGNMEVKVTHGDFRARDLKSVRKLKVKFGKVKVNSIEEGSIELGSVSSANFNTLGEVMVTSSSSNIEVEEAGLINIRSKHDDIRLISAKSVDGNFALSDLQISELLSGLSAEANMGSLRVRSIDSGMDRLIINSKRTDIVLGSLRDFQGKIELNLTNDVEQVELAEEMNIEHSAVDADGRLRISGNFGASGNSIVQIKADQGFVKIAN